MNEKSFKYMYNIDLYEFEQQIRADERSKLYKKINQRTTELFILLLQKFIGIVIMIGIIISFNAGLFYNSEIQGNDITILLIIIPLVLVLIFSNKKNIG